MGKGRWWFLSFDFIVDGIELLYFILNNDNRVLCNANS